MGCLLLGVLFVALPAVEVYLLIVVGRAAGPLATLGIILLTGAVGALLARSQGLQVLQRLRENVSSGQPIQKDVVAAASVLVGGTLLMTPGLVTDTLGLALLFEPTRHWIVLGLLAALRAHLRRKLQDGSVSWWVTGAAPGEPPPNDVHDLPPDQYEVH